METTVSLGAWLRQAAATLADHDETPALIARVVAAHTLRANPSWVASHPEYSLSPAQLDSLQAMILRLCEGEPLPYLLGEWEFYGLKLVVNSSALIPRPETELLVEMAINWLRKHPERRWAADVGTGTGCIAVALAHEIPDLRFVAADISSQALQLAVENAREYHLEQRIHFTRSHLLSAVETKFDLIAANLPYIPSSKLDNLAVSRYEPHRALDGGPDGFSLIRALLEDSPRLIANGGLLLLEIESGQGDMALELASAIWPEADVYLHKDLAGHPRLLQLQIPNRSL